MSAVDNYRGRPAEREAIAEAGYRQVRNAHTSRHCAEHILALLVGHDLSTMVGRRRRMMDIEAGLSTVYEIAWQCCIQAAMRYASGSSEFERYRRMARQYDAPAAKIRGDLASLLDRAS